MYLTIGYKSLQMSNIKIFIQLYIIFSLTGVVSVVNDFFSYRKLPNNR